MFSVNALAGDVSDIIRAELERNGQATNNSGFMSDISVNQGQKLKEGAI
ncbi:hypothetical protein ACIQCT_23435 [Enterobacter cancerogenus]